MKIVTKVKNVPDSSIVKYGKVTGVLTRNKENVSRVFIVTGNGCGFEIGEDDNVELVKSSADMAEAWMEQYRLIMSTEGIEYLMSKRRIE